MDWSDKIKNSGIIALHDTSISNYNPLVAELGSFKFFNEIIKYDSRFEIIDQVDSLNILQKK